MRNKISDKERLNHILETIDSILEFTKGISYQQYSEDYKLKLAIVKLFEIIGEAANGITEGASFHTLSKCITRGGGNYGIAVSLPRISSGAINIAPRWGAL